MHFGAKWAFGQLNKIDTSMQTGKPFKKQPFVLAIGVAVVWMSSAYAQAPASATVSDVPPPVSAASIAASVAADKAKKSEVVASNNDLLSLYQEAANNDPVFLSARYAYDAGREKRWQGFAGLLPQVVGVANETKSDQSSMVTSSGSIIPRQGTLMSRGWNIRLSQPLFSWDKWETARQGFISSDIAAAQYAAAEQDLVIRVTEAYFNVLNAQDTLNLARNKKALIAEQLEQAKRNFEVGTATITDTHEAQSRFDLVVAQEIAAQADLTIKRGALEQIVGKPIGELKSLAPQAKISLVVNEDPKTAKSKLSNKGKKKTAVTQAASKTMDVNAVVGVSVTQSMNDWVSQAEDVSYSVIASKLSYEVAKRETSKSVGGHLPSVDFVLQRGYSDSETVISTIKTYSNQGTIQLNVPIFSSGFTQSVVREKAALEKKALSDYQNTRRSIAQATRQAFLGFNQGLAQVKAYEAAEVSAMSALESNKLGYEVGVRINIDVLNAQDTLFTTRRDLAKARYDTILNGLRLKAQAAVLSSEDLQAVNALLK